MDKVRPIKMTCGSCGSTNVTIDAPCSWNVAKQEWQIQDILDHVGQCWTCDKPRTIVALPLKPMTARLWVWINGSPVKIKVTEGKALTWSRFALHDEGHELNSRQWWLTGDGIVHYEWTRDSTDCDGRTARFGRSKCSIHRLRSAPFHDERHPEVVGAAWEDGETRQRDYAAEKMGY